MRYKNMLILLAMLLLWGCTISPRYKGVAEGGNTGNVLGIQADENQQVVAIEPESAATIAGVTVGDVLVSLTWVLSEAPEELPSTDGSAAANATTEVTATVAPLRPPAGVENKTILFTESEEIRDLISYGVPLRLQITRQGQVHNLTIIPTPRVQAEGATATPAAPNIVAY